MGKLTPDTILREEGLETLSLVPDFMTFPIFLLLWGLLPCIQGACELKDNAVDLLSVDYAGFLEDKSDVTAYVDEISVKMKGGHLCSRTQAGPVAVTSGVSRRMFTTKRRQMRNGRDLVGRGCHPVMISK